MTFLGEFVTFSKKWGIYPPHPHSSVTGLQLANVRVIGGSSYLGVFLYVNGAQYLRGMQKQFGLVRVPVIGGSCYREFTVFTQD